MYSSIFHANRLVALGPLSPYIDSYIKLLNEEGYAPRSVCDHVRAIVRFSRSLQRSDCEIRDLDEAVVERFLHHKPKSHFRCAPATLRRNRPAALSPLPRSPAEAQKTISQEAWKRRRLDDSIWPVDSFG